VRLPATRLIPSRSGLAGYALAFATVAAAAAVRLALGQYFGSNYPFLTFFPAVLLTATLAGLWPGVVATAMTVGLVWLWIAPPHWHLLPLAPADGVRLLVFCALGVATSVAAHIYRTARQNAAQYEKALALRDSEEQLRVFFDSPAVGAVEVTLGGRFSRMNDRFCQIAGHSREELLAMSPLNLSPPEDRELDGERLHQFLDGAVPLLDLERRYVRKDGSIAWVHETSGTIRDSSGRAMRTAGIVEDITERKRVEHALKESEERFRVAFQTSPDAIVITRLEDGVCIAVNEGFSRITGWSDSEVLGRSALELHLWDDLADRARLLDGLKRDGFVQNLEARFRLKDGSGVPTLTSARLLALHGQQLILSITREVSAWKRAEEERDRLKSGLYEAAKIDAIGQLAGGIAHDFNNLLTVILSGAGALKLAVGEGSPPDLEIVEDIRAAGVRARDLTRQLLAFARRQVIARVPLDLNALVRGGEKLLQRVLGDGVLLVVVTDPALAMVRCDPGQIEQVLVNLAVNARDAMPGGGRLTIETANSEVDEVLTASHPFMSPGPHVRITVRDSGHGMTADVKAHAFEPFFTTKPVGRGTGLGLATVYGIVKQNEGYILLESAPGLGASFAMYFPRFVENVADVEAAAGARCAGST
jgi:PAS domain S-box-containing protein